MKENRIGRECGTHTEFWCGNLKQKDRLEELSISEGGGGGGNIEPGLGGTVGECVSVCV